MHDGEEGASSILLLLRRHSKLNVGVLEAENKTNKMTTYNVHLNNVYNVNLVFSTKLKCEKNKY